MFGSLSLETFEQKSPKGLKSFSVLIRELAILKMWRRAEEAGPGSTTQPALNTNVRQDSCAWQVEA